MMAADKRGFLRTEHEPEDWGAPARDKQREETQEGGALLGRMEGLPVTLTRHRSSQGREPYTGPRGGPEQEVGVEVGLADQAGFAKTKTQRAGKVGRG